ncbi:MAG: hypothetical protein GX621_00855, partial [Pirellulaceae bacterium]|nr:hypothetical protein [Pirellulaceae bacterium]
DGLGTFTGSDDQYLLFDSPTPRAGSGSSLSWQIMAHGESFDSRRWIVYDGDQNASTGTNLSTGVEIATGVVYDFTIVVDPVARTYDTLISVDGLLAYDSTVLNPDGLGWRTDATEIGGYLCFASRGDEVYDTRAFSLDGVMITQSAYEPIPGDANGDGVVNEADAKVLASNWGLASGTSWAKGDFDGDGKIDARDAAILAANWGATASGTPGESVASVPEPGVFSLLVIGGLGAVAMSRRGRRQQENAC